MSLDQTNTFEGIDAEAATRGIELQGDLLAAVAPAILDGLRRGLIVLDPDGRPGFVNEAGRALISSGDPLGIQPDGRMRIAHKGAQSRMERFIRESDQTASPLAMVLHRRRRVAPIAVVFSWLSVASCREKRCLVTSFDPAGHSTPALSLLRELYGVTPAQSRVVELLYRGLSAPEISSALGCSIHTVRAHLKGAFRRCAVHSQAELVRLLASLPKLD